MSSVINRYYDMSRHVRVSHLLMSSCFNCNRVKLNAEIISKLFQCCILHVTMSETEIKLFQLLKEF